jgi:hypothetical protein
MISRTFHTVDGLRAFLRNRRGLAHIEILHDNACTVSRCVCRPWYRVSDVTHETLAEAERRQSAWIAKSN